MLHRERLQAFVVAASKGTRGQDQPSRARERERGSRNARFGSPGCDHDPCASTTVVLPPGAVSVYLTTLTAGEGEKACLGLSTCAAVATGTLTGPDDVPNTLLVVVAALDVVVVCLGEDLGLLTNSMARRETAARGRGSEVSSGRASGERERERTHPWRS